MKNSQSGNVFVALFATVALIGLLGAGLTTFIKGPLRSSISITRTSAAENQMEIASQSAISAALSGPGSGDCDGDGMVEALEFRAATGSTPKPVGGGLLPLSLGLAKKDPWGTEYGYCVWDHGSAILTAACQVTSGVNKRLAGSNTASLPAIAIISAGPDKKFTTTCRAFATGVDLVEKANPGDDDIILAQTYEEASAGSGGLWSLKNLDQTTATINKNIEVGGGDARFLGMGSFDSINAMGEDFLQFVSGLKIAGPSVVAICSAANKGVLRSNSAGDGWEICDGAASWNAISAETAGEDITWPILAPNGNVIAPSYSFLNSNGSGLWSGSGSLQLASADQLDLTATGINFSGSSTDFRVSSSGGVKIGEDTGACVNAIKGTMKYVAASKTYEFCNGTSWMPFPQSAAAGGDAHTPPPPKDHAIVFVTSSTYNGNLGGLAGADDKCNTEAQQANLPGMYKAWLSDSSNSPDTRFNKLTIPYKKVDGTTVASNWTDLTDGSLASAINLRASGYNYTGTVWTATNTNGTAKTASTCSNWKSTSGNGFVGTVETASSWTDQPGQPCNTARRLYCIQQTDSEIGGGWEGDCNDYTSTIGLEKAKVEPDFVINANFGRTDLPDGFGIDIGTKPFAGGRKLITGCATGQGNPLFVRHSTAETGGIAKAPIAAFSRPEMNVDVPPEGSYTGKITFGTAVDINYTVTVNPHGSILFVTDDLYSGNLGGISGADAKCQAAADASPYLAGYYVWKAVLSDSSVDASNRLTVTYPVMGMRPLSTSNITVLASSTIFGPNFLDDFRSADWSENRNRLADRRVWTGSNANGTRKTANCSNWTSSLSSVQGATGGASYSNDWLVGPGDAACNEMKSLYCMSQGPQPVVTELKAFLSSTRYTGNMGGLEGADAKCQERATAAGLPGSYKAWLSDATGSPSTRFVKGTVPYKLTNGTTIANNWNDLIDGTLAATINVHEDGTTYGGVLNAFTNTKIDGTLDLTTQSCSNWTSALSTNTGSDGNPSTTGSNWTDRSGSGYTCNSNLFLYCFQQNGITPEPETPPPPPPADKKVFITSTAWNGNLGGLSGADAKCQSDATSSGLSGTFKAWLSDSTASPSTRFTKSNGPYKLTNGTVIANNWADLTDGTPIAAINISADGTAAKFASVWTGTDPAGVLRTGTCSDWTIGTTSQSGRAGSITNLTYWTDQANNTCNQSKALYCFEQDAAPPPPPESKIFVTSQTYQINRFGGTNGADMKCTALAGEAGLPGAYRAWISDGSSSPNTRFVKSIGPYKLVNGTTIANDWTDLTDGTIAAAINIDETGAAINDITPNSWTATNTDGTAAAANCSNWTVFSGNVNTGSKTATNASWTTNSLSCGMGARLICMAQPGGTVPKPSAGTIVFQTSVKYNGNLGGLTGADAKCQAVADAVPIMAVYNWKAVLSSSTVNARDRLTITYPVRNTLDDVLTASNFFSSWANGNGIRDETGGTKSTFSWTGTNADGTKSADNCNNWTSSSSSQNGVRGDSSFTSKRIYDAIRACNDGTIMSIYCMSQGLK